MKHFFFRHLRLLLLLAMCLGPAAARAQILVVSGRVTAPDGGAVPGASIIERGTTNGVSTDADGAYSLSVQPNSTLVFSSVGYAAQTIAVAGHRVVNATLNVEETALNEAVIIGYGTQVKADLTGAVIQLDAKNIVNQPVTSFEQAIQGRVPGVVINQGSGKLGQGINVQVRGTSSVTASSRPLYVIDGMPITSQDQTQVGGEPLNPLADLNPNDIESVSILKDAAAAAIYGSRAANGVVLIKTKRGSEQQTRVTMGNYYGTSAPTRLRQFLNAEQYRTLLGESLSNGLKISPTDPKADYPDLKTAFMEEGGIDYNSKYNTPWDRLGFRNQGRFKLFGADAASTAQYDFSATGGNDKTRFYVGAAFNDQKGIIVGNRFRRGSLRINVDHNVSRYLRLGLNTALARTVNDRVSGDNEFSNPLQLNALTPMQPLYDPVTGQLNAATIYYNNLIDQELGSNRASTYRTFSTAYANFTPLKGLTLRTEIGGDFLNLNEDLVRGAGTQDGGANGYAYSAQTQSVNYTNTNTATYSFDLKALHHFELLLGESYQRADQKVTAAEGRGFATPEFTRIASTAIKTGGTTSFEDPYAFTSVFGRANYNYQNKYLASVSVRRDGSSRFGSDKPYGVFGAASVGYLLSEESFLKNNKVVNYLKVRASYGLTGNAEIGNFRARKLVSSLPYADQAGTSPGAVVNGLFVSFLGNPKLSWENTRQFDLGLEFGLFSDRITGELDWYQKNTTDLLLNRPILLTSGYTTITENTGALRNRGLELALNGRVLTGDLKLSVGMNLSFNRNLITALPTPVSPTNNTISNVLVNEPLGVFYTQKFAGVDPANGDALYYLANGKKTNDYTKAAVVKVGDPNPKCTGGLNSTASYKNFELSVLSNFSLGNDIYNAAGLYQSANANFFDNQTVDQLDRWRKLGDITDVPQARYGANNGTRPSSRWVQDGSFFRLKNVTLAYNLPTDLVKKGYLQSVRVYLTGQNLATFTKYQGYDPEVNSYGLGSANYLLGHDFYTPPLAKTFLLGVNFGF